MRLVPRRRIPERTPPDLEEVAAACSRNCSHIPPDEQSPVGLTENLPWSVTERVLLTEALAFLPSDPCVLAAVVGTKSCREVGQMLLDPKEQRWIRRANDKDAHHQALFEENRRYAAELNIGRYAADLPSSDSDDDALIVMQDMYREELKKKKKKRRAAELQVKRRSGATARKSNVSITVPEDGEEEERLGYISFIPCDHEGQCYRNSKCRCFQSSLVCQPACGCHAVRYMDEGGYVFRRGEECSFTQDGCDCVDGFCNGEECRCYNLNSVVCNPDECQCDCKIPPWEIGLRERRCKNVDVVIHRHKQTFIGKSTVEGFGLFAGEHFDKGDLVGEYLGIHWPFDKADSVLAVGDEKERTYAYDIRDVTVDGTTLGAKVRFINCSVMEKDENCVPVMVCVKGHWHLRLITKRAVEPGTEFLFEYGLNGKRCYKWYLDAREAAGLSP